MKSSMMLWFIRFVVVAVLVISNSNYKTYFSGAVSGRAYYEATRGCRKLLKEELGTLGTTDHHKDVSTGSNTKVEDYDDPFDPVPDSKNSIVSGPIEHGSPAIPYVPDPSVPSPPIMQG